MPSPLYSLLNLFESPSGYLIEIARTKGQSPVTWVTEWIWIEQRHAITLQPVKEGREFVFEEGNLSLDNQQGKLLWSHGRVNALKRRDTQAFPFPARSLLELHLGYPVQRQRRMFGRDLVGPIRVDGGEVIFPIDLHAMTGEEKQADVAFFQNFLEVLQGPVHVDMAAVRFPDHLKTAGLQLASYVLGIVYRVLQFIDRFVRGITDHERIEAAAHQFAALYASWTAWTKGECNPPCRGYWPWGVERNTNNHSVV